MKKIIYGLTVILALFAVISLFGISQLFSPDRHGFDKNTFALQSIAKVANSNNNVKAERPNLVIILADDLGFADIGINGSKAIKTPHIDELANQGVNFVNGYSSAPICTPSRAGLLTGRYPARSGLVQPMGAVNDSFLRKVSRQAMTFGSNLGAIDNMGGPNLTKFLPLDEYTIAEFLKDQGYATAAFGKWHLGDFSVKPEYHPKHYGFEKFVGFNMSNDDWPVAFFQDEEKVIEDIGIEQSHYTKLFTDEAISFIEQNNNKPFFVFLSQKDPHQPFFPSEQFKGTSEGGPYGDAVSEFDWNVGRVIDTLKKLDLADNTLVLVTSDNGPWYQGSAGELRGRKGQSYEGGFRVPTIFWGSQLIKQAKVETTPMMQIDILPTMADILDVQLPTNRVIDGQSLRSVLTGEEHKLNQRPLYFFHDYDIEAVRVGNWKYIGENSHYVWPVPLDKPDSKVGSALSMMNYSPPNSDEVIATLGDWPALYNLELDPGEAYNVAKRYPEKVKELKNLKQEFSNSVSSNPRGLLSRGGTNE